MSETKIGVPLVPSTPQLTALSNQLAYNLQINSSQVVFSIYQQFVAVIYTVTSTSGACLDCQDIATATYLTSTMTPAVCTILGLTNCAQIVGTTCLTAPMDSYFFPPPPEMGYTLNASNCAANIFLYLSSTTGITLTTASILYSTAPTLNGYIIPNPGQSAVYPSSSLLCQVSNTRGNTSLVFTDQDIVKVTSQVLGRPATAIGLPIISQIAVPPSPPPTSECKKPHLGTLCGADAIGAIIGIILGGLIILALLIALIIYLFARPSSPIVVDDYAWAARYAHIINANQAAYYTSAVQQKGSPYVVKGTPSPQGYPTGVMSQ